MPLLLAHFSLVFFCNLSIVFAGGGKPALILDGGGRMRRAAFENLGTFFIFENASVLSPSVFL